MRIQTITKFVDARQSQGRVILWLACGHKISFENCEPGPEHDPTGKEHPCRFCPDPSPVEITLDKSVQQLWKEAGEP